MALSLSPGFTLKAVPSPFLGPLESRTSIPPFAIRTIIHHKNRCINCSLQNTSQSWMSKRNLLQTAGSIGMMAAASKTLGLLRETLLAAIFGVGPVITAFNYSSILPGFFMSIFGGVNGPVQITTMSFLSKYERKHGEVLLGKISTIIAVITGGITLVLLVFPCHIIDALAPGLLIECSLNGPSTRNLAIIQLRIMAPCALLAGLTGVGFGSLSAVGRYDVLALSPSLSSLSIIVVVVAHIAHFGICNASVQSHFTGAVSLAVGALIGGLLQLLWQAKTHDDLNLVFLSFQSLNPFKDRDVHEISIVLLPAILGCSMLQFATFTDLYFASFIPGAAAALGYANLLVMAPLGILSSSILLPMISLLSNFTKPTDYDELKNKIGEALVLILVTTLPMTAIVLPLSRPLVEVALQRLHFDALASKMVSSILSYYVAGSSIYLMRELFTQMFYILGDGKVPFCISVAAIATNALLDWVFVRVFAFGPEGLVLATSIVHAASVVALFTVLYRKLNGLPLQKWFQSCCISLGASFLSCIVAGISYKWCFRILLKLRLLWVVKMCAISLASCASLATFSLFLYLFGQTELQTLKRLLYHKMKKQT